MTIVELPEIMFSYVEMAEFTQYRIRQDIAAGAKASIAVPVPYNRVWFIYRYKFGDIVADVLNFRWNGIRNARTNMVLLGAEHTNFDTIPMPYLIAKGTSGQVVVTNTDTVERTFEMTLDICSIDEMMMPKLKSMLGWKFKI
jgi:hypothetical protein